MECIIGNDQLGNFGFLLNYKQDFLFDLGQQAESYLYTNLRLSAVYIRQLTEAFYDTVINDFTPALKVQSGPWDEPTIADRQKAICSFFSRYQDSYYREHVFPVFPGRLGDEQARVRCPTGEGDNYFSKENHNLVDPDRKTIFVWDAIRKVGNAGSHAVLTASNQKWLEAPYVETALKELCNRMNHYFYKKHNPSKIYNLHAYQPSYTCYGTGQILYGIGTAQKHPQNGILPAYAEHLCVSVVPEPGENGRFQNRRNRFALVRSYERDSEESDTELDRFLIQSQRVYLKLQRHGSVPGIPDFSVLADLRARQERYVSAYIFNARPVCMDYNTLERSGVYRDVRGLVSLFLGILAPLEKMCELGIYHRTLTHQSIRLLHMPDETTVPYIVDFETCKLFDEETKETVYRFANAETAEVEDGKYRPYRENLQQYNGSGWDEHTTPEEYRKEVLRRMAGIFMNILCPAHLDDVSSDETFTRPATKDEIFGDYNWIGDELLRNGALRSGVETLADTLVQAETGALDFSDIRMKLEAIG